MIKTLKSQINNEVIIAEQYNQSVIAQTDKSIAIATSLYSTATTLVKNTIAIATGISSIATALKSDTLAISWGGRVKGVKGSWIMAIDFDDAKGMDMAVGRVDGINIKADTWYILKDGKLVEAGEE